MPGTAKTRARAGKRGGPHRPDRRAGGVSTGDRREGTNGWKGHTVTADLTARARAGDQEAFRELVAPYQHELQVHCYRILGSAHDAEDALQETLLAAWRGLGGFEGRASVRTWLYRIATSRCLNALRASSRRVAMDGPQSWPDPPEPTRLGEAPWLEPYPASCWKGSRTKQQGRRLVMRLARRSRWPSSPHCRSCRRASVPC